LHCQASENLESLLKVLELLVYSTDSLGVGLCRGRLARSMDLLSLVVAVTSHSHGQVLSSGPFKILHKESGFLRRMRCLFIFNYSGYNPNCFLIMLLETI